MKKLPCRDCTDRKIGCHASCTNYQESSKERLEELAKIRKAKENENNATSFAIDGMVKGKVKIGSI